MSNLGTENKSSITVKRKSDDGHRIISVRITEDTLRELDRIASEANCSRNELINTILRHGVKNVEIK